MKMNLLEYKRNVFSQNGEDGIIAKIFELIGTKNKICCEFGAWDGVHFCNIRNLVITKEWTGVFIEGDAERYSQIENNYTGKKIFAINSFVDSGSNKLSTLLNIHAKPETTAIDFLSIDIDGLDYEIFETLDIQPNVICIEVNAGHHPNNSKRIDKKIAENNVGQSLNIFSGIAAQKGYALVCYSGNAFYVKKELLVGTALEPLTNEEAYSNFLDHLSLKEKEWLFLVNTGTVAPYYKFENKFLEKENLGFKEEQIKNIEAGLKTPGLKSRIGNFIRRLKN
jgi:hypothetical protein